MFRNLNGFPLPLHSTCKLQTAILKLGYNSRASQRTDSEGQLAAGEPLRKFDTLQGYQLRIEFVFIQGNVKYTGWDPTWK
jgi:hypothetical protein